MSNYKRTFDENHREKISRALKGRKLSDETKRKIGEKIKNAWAKVPKTTTGNIWNTSAQNNENNENNINN